MHFGYTRADYDALTQTERAFIMKAYEDMVVSDSTTTRNAVFNATINANRKKGKPFRKLWQRARRQADREKARDDLSTIRDIEKQEKKGKSGLPLWLERVYAGSGRKIPQPKKYAGKE